VRRCFVCHLCVTLFVFSLLFMCLFSSDCQISFDPVQIQSMTLTSSTLQIRKQNYSGDFNIVIFACLCTLSFYAFNMDDVSLFTDSSFLFLAILYCIDILYNFFCFCTGFRPTNDGRLIRLMRRGMHTDQELFPWDSNPVFPGYVLGKSSLPLEPINLVCTI